MIAVESNPRSARKRSKSVLDLVVLGVANPDVIQLIEDINEDRSTWRILGFLDDNAAVGSSFQNYPVLGPIDLPLPTQVAMVQSIVSRPAVSKRIIERVGTGIDRFPNLVHPNAFVHRKKLFDTYAGRGNLVFQGCSIQPGSRFGHFNYVNISCVVGHDVALGSFNSFGPGVILSGRAYVGSQCFIGSAAVVTAEASVGDNSFVCAASLVSRNVPQGSKVAGNPARIIGTTEVTS